MSAETQEESGPDLDWMTAQPYDAWAEVRQSECPVMNAGLDIMGPGTGTFFQVAAFKDADAVLRDDKTFSSSINGDHIGQFMGDLILALGGEEHRKYRNLVAKAFRASQLERWDDTLVRPIINRLIDAIAPLGRADLVASVTAQYPVQVICGIAGVPLEDSAQFAQWAEEINTGPMAPERGHAASKAMVDYLRPLVEARRAESTGDFLSDLVHSEVDGERLSDEKIYGFLRLLLPAGGETTFRVMGNALLALLQHPDDLARVYVDRGLIPEVIEETLRWETSVTMVNRETTNDVDVGGCPIPKGAGILALVGSANRDENHYDRPDEWDPHREPKPHMAFGTGIHQCLGMHLARLELRIGLDGVLTRLPNLRPDPAFPPPEIRGLPFRSPPALHVLFDAA
jgi:cytochrome P450